ncbi:MBL fold metallo-hydrolase [Sporosarcina thermotolerans]|uniref:MBL fold metallo-hydrolase n=1 Tax=Sporosarcina thermotolerans TaxID=633404 RepID=A0AAW9A666_9BACL|nr:MBL fold metallo-hydrolase [Sporosarcina thermotolerans]MDW0115639.1 MBL fold metallo-hydrolase [Sporosarcina thermotolerans]WHT47073.1 MBL fold metallo-hydrolase [Sporosarcina thermotolerans]
MSTENAIKNSDTTIQFYAGLKTIGGTIFEVKYKEERFIADFGMVFQNKEGVQARPQNIISELQAIGVIPLISGVLKTDEIDENATIAISHLHLDHIGLLQYVHPDVPIIMSEGSKTLYEHLHTIGEEPNVDVAKQVKSVPFHQALFVSEHIQVEFFPVNHDAPGASAMRITTPDTTIVYTGDVRLHEADVDTANLPTIAGSPDLLIIETTNVQEEFLDINPVIQSEADKLTAGLLEIKSPLVFNIYHRNLKRLEILIEAARQKGKTIVFEPETAYLVQAYKLEAPHVRYLLDERYDSKISNQIHAIQPITVAELNSEFSQVWLQSSYHHMMTLLDLPVKGATYVHSNGVPLGSFDPVYAELLEWIEKLGMELVVLGVSGHAAAAQIKWLADAMQAKVTIPLHGFTPELLQGPNQTFLPEKGEIYPISTLLGEK